MAGIESLIFSCLVVTIEFEENRIFCCNVRVSISFGCVWFYRIYILIIDHC